MAVSREEMRQIEMSYPLKINLVLRGKMMFPCPDCKTPHDSRTLDCDKWCLTKCSYSIDRSLLSDRQLEIHNERRKSDVQQALETISRLCEEKELSDADFFMKAEEALMRLKK